MSKTTRRDFLKTTGTLAAMSTLPLSMVELAFADTAKNFTFAYISDAHIQHISGTKFVRNWDRGLIRAVAETNLLVPKPEFVVFGGDLAQLGTKEELDHGAEILSKLNYKMYCVMGEHDYYLDLGEYWSKLFGAHHYSFIRRSEIKNWPGINATALYAVYRLSENAGGEQYYLPGEYEALFLQQENQSGIALHITDGRIVRIDYIFSPSGDPNPFGGFVEDYTNRIEKVILAPKIR